MSILSTRIFFICIRENRDSKLKISEYWKAGAYVPPAGSSILNSFLGIQIFLKYEITEKTMHMLNSLFSATMHLIGAWFSPERISHHILRHGYTYFMGKTMHFLEHGFQS